MVAVKIPGGENIKHPKGLAVDSLRKILYVVNGHEGRIQIDAARLYETNNGHLGLQAPVKIVDNVKSEWVAVDVMGRSFFAADNAIWRMESAYVVNKLNAAKSTPVQTNTTEDEDAGTDESSEEQPTEMPLDKRFVSIYNGDDANTVNMPQGLAVDGHRIYWTNGENGEQDGTVVRGLEEPIGDTSAPIALATNIPKAHGLCLSNSRVFFMDDELKLYSTKQNGGSVVQITDKLKKPRGCAFDGDGTVFVADHDDNKIVSFAGASTEMGPRKMSLALSTEAPPYGVTVLRDLNAGRSGASRAHLGASLALVLLACVLATAVADL